MISSGQLQPDKLPREPVTNLRLNYVYVCLRSFSVHEVTLQKQHMYTITADLRPSTKTQPNIQ